MVIKVKDGRRFIIRDRETGTEITRARSIGDAQEIIDKFEEEDTRDGIYEDNFYEIYDDLNKEVVI